MTAKKFGIVGATPKLYLVGTELDRVDRGFVLMMYESVRYTQDRDPPVWARKASKGEAYPPQFVDDLDWLANTQFAVTINGRLDKRSRVCLEKPTWPTRPNLVDQPIEIQAQHAPNLRYPGWSRELAALRTLSAAETVRENRGKTGLQILKEAQERALAREAAGLPPED